MDINGTPDTDFLNDTPGDDLINAGAGDDFISITNGRDKVDGGPGADDLSINWGAETVAITNASAEAGYVFRLVGGAGRSVDLRNVEDLRITAGSGNDNFTGAGGDDTIYDANPSSGLPSGNDTLSGGAGDDSILVRDGQDAVDGGDGNDVLFIEYGGSTSPVTSGVAPSGFDARYVSGDRSVNLVGFEELVISGGSAGDTLIGREGDDSLYDSPFGPFGIVFDNDLLNGAGGDDVLFLNSGHDQGDGGAGDDTGWLTWRTSTAPIVMGAAPAGYDIRFESGANRSANFVGVERFIIQTGSGNDVVETRGGDDIFFDHDTAVDSDSFIGGGGSDTHFVRMGRDRGDGGDGVDSGRLSWANSTIPIITSTPEAGYEIRFESGPDRRVDWKGFETFTIESGTGNDNITLLGSQDFIFDEGGDDRFDGGGGDDFIAAGAGNDEAIGGEGSDNIDGQDGNDTLRGGLGNDFLYGGAGVDALFGDDGDDAGFLDDDSDSFTGGAGTDTAIIAGNYSLFTARASPDTEVLLIGSGTDTRFGPGDALFDYDIRIPNAVAGSNSILTVQATGLVAGEDLRFDGSAQQNGHLRIFAGRGVDQLIGGSGNDGFFFDADANGSLTGADRIVGGGGADTIALRGNYIGGKAVTFGDASITTIEVVTFLSGHENPHGGPIDTNGFDYAVTMANANVAAGTRLDIIGATLRANESVSFDGRAETDGAYRIILGAGADTVFGGQSADLLHGGLGADQLDGAGGSDIYVYRQVAESTGASADTIVLGSGDRIDLSFIDANGNPADGNQAFAFIGADAFGNVAGQLRAYQANGGWIVEADVDGNGVADLVINVTTPLTITAEMFIP